MNSVPSSITRDETIINNSTSTEHLDIDEIGIDDVAPAPVDASTEDDQSTSGPDLASEANADAVVTTDEVESPTLAEGTATDDDAVATDDTSSIGGSTMAITIRPVEQGDFFAWYGLFAGYADFYEQPLTDDRAMRAWAWLFSDDFATRGIVAVDTESGDVIGLAHVREFERPLAGETGLYIDDLFVSETRRGEGVGTALIEAVTEQAREGGHKVVRWITAEDNATARALYDQLATKTPFVTYDRRVD